MMDTTSRELEPELDPGDAENPVAALYSLAAKGPHVAGSVSPITSLLHDKQESVRAAAAHALSRVRAHPEIAVPALVAFLQSGPRLAGSSRTIGLLPWMGAKPRRDRCEAIGAVGAYGAEARDAAPTLVKILRAERPEETSLAAAALGEVGDSGGEVHKILFRFVILEKAKARRFFWFHLNKENAARALWQVRKAAATACGRLGIVEASERILYHMVKNAYNESREFLPYRWHNMFRQAAVFALADLSVAGDKSEARSGNTPRNGGAPNRLSEEARPVPRVRCADTGGDAVRSALLALLEDPCRNLQWSAAIALRQMGHETPFPLDDVLEFTLSPNRSDLREEGLSEITLQNLWRLGTEGRRALPRLLEALNATPRQFRVIVESLALLAPNDPEVRNALAVALSAPRWTWDVNLDNRAFAVLRTLAFDALTSPPPYG